MSGKSNALSEETDMIKIIGTRGSGKTTKLMEIASKEGYTLVEPSSFMADYVRMRAKETGHDIKVISSHQFLWEHPGHREEKYLVDELDMFLIQLGIKGYSNGERDSN